jgi:biotin synthase-like enzyme
MTNFVDRIKQNNQTHIVDTVELQELIAKANTIFQANFSNEVYFERSVFTNWTCAIADCKYCYLSTKPKYNPQEATKALRSKESILAEILICKAMGWKIGYITGGLRVESADYLIDLLNKIEIVQGEKTMMNFGPYSHNLVQKFKPHLLGMGSAVESFDEELHNFICPSKPLKSLMLFLENLGKENLQKYITIILGMGEKKDDVETVIENIKKYNINKIQLCFLKPQENTVFNDVPPPNPEYMAWWVAKIRIACPNIKINIALVKERIADVSLYLQAGANGFTRFMVFNDVCTKYATELVEGCKKAGRELQGHFNGVPEIDVEELVNQLPFEKDTKDTIKEKADQYYQKLTKLKASAKTLPLA